MNIRIYCDYRFELPNSALELKCFAAEKMPGWVVVVSGGGCDGGKGNK